MTRFEELTMKLVDRQITDDERAELTALVEGDETTRRRYFALLDMEAALRRGREREVDVADEVMARITARQAADDRLVRGVMAHARRNAAQVPWRKQRAQDVAPGASPSSASRSPSGASARGDRWWLWAAPAIAVAAAAVALFVLRQPPRQATRSAEPIREGEPPVAAAPAGEGFAVLDLQGELEIARDGRTIAAAPGTALQAGDAVTVPAATRAAIGSAGGTRVDLDSGARVSLEAAQGPRASGAGPRGARMRVRAGEPPPIVRVVAGAVHAQVRPTPGLRAFIARSPHARATSSAARFALRVESAQTRVDVLEGSVVFERLLEGTTTIVSAGGSAVAGGAENSERERKAATPPPPVAGPRTIFSYDFESGELPKYFFAGQPVAAPPRAGNRFALIASLGGYFNGDMMVSYERWNKGVVDYAPTMVVSFDYWLSADADWLALQMWSEEVQLNFAITNEKPVREEWSHAEVRLRDLAPWREGDRPLREGDRLENILIFTRSAKRAGVPLYVDNLKLVEYPREAEPRASSWSAKKP